MEASAKMGDFINFTSLFINRKDLSEIEDGKKEKKMEMEIK